MKNVAFLFILIFFSCSLSASHLAGGIVSYECVDSAKGLYRITFRKYRSPGGVPLPSKEYLSIRIYPGGTEQRYTLQRSKIDTVAIAPCIDTLSIYERHTYVSNAIPLPEGSTIDLYSEGSCCRSADIVNLTSSGITGERLFSRVPNVLDYPCNSSPLISEIPALIFPYGQPYITQLKATDPDGDSLSFFLATPLSNSPYKSDSFPPFLPVTYAQGYSAEEPFGSDASFSIDPVSGKIRANIKRKGRFAVAYEIREYRKQKLIGRYFLELLHTVKPALKPEPQYLFFHDTILSCNGSISISESCYEDVFWDFTWPGNKDTGTSSNPSFTYPGPGSYTLMYLNRTDAYTNDTFFFTVLVDSAADKLSHLMLRLPDDTTLCQGQPLQLEAFAVNEIRWIKSNGMNCSNCSEFLVNTDSSRTFTASVEMNGCIAYDSFRVNIYPDPGSIDFSDSIICLGDTLTLSAQGYERYRWRPGRFLSDKDSSITLAWPDKEIEFTLTAHDSFGCRKIHNITVGIYPDIVRLWASPSDKICKGDTIGLSASGFTSFNWSPDSLLSAAQAASPLAWPSENTAFTLTGIDSFGCIKTQSIDIKVFEYPGPLNISIDTLSGCFREIKTVTVHAKQASDYSWNPESWIDSNPKNSYKVKIKILGDTLFTVTAIRSGICRRDSTFPVLLSKSDPNSFSGKVRVGSASVMDVKISMISYNQADSSLHEIASTISKANGDYQIRDTGLFFFLRAVPLNESNASYLLPRYLKSAFYWSDADTFAREYCEIKNQLNFHLVKASSQTGPGLIRCKVVKENGQALTPMILYLVQNDQIQYAAVTDSNGYFSIGNLPLESYLLYGDWPYLDNELPPEIQLSSEQASLTNLLAVKKGNKLVLSKITGIDSQAVLSGIRIYPNPVSDYLFLDIGMDIPTPSYQLLTQNGSISSSGALHGGLNRISLGQLESGFYLLKFFSKNGVRIFKVLKLD